MKWENPKWYKFDFYELIKILFYKKLCPYCGSKLERKKDVIALGKGWNFTELDGYQNVNKYEIRFHYFCHKCNGKIELYQLTKRRFY